MLITRTFSLTNFIIATSALSFQVFVLYPWHKRLDDDFETLKEEHVRTWRLYKDIEEERLVVLKELRSEMGEISKAVEELRGKGKGWR
jgi:hypothetical protein